jgi:hypothetical protein
MDGLSLLQEAWAAGLTVQADGNRLIIRGPWSADAVAHRLLTHKPVVLAAIQVLTPTVTMAGPQEPALAAVSPRVGPCPWCGRRTWWRSIHGALVCGWCHLPAMPELVAEWVNRAETA